MCRSGVPEDSSLADVPKAGLRTVNTLPLWLSPCGLECVQLPIHVHVMMGSGTRHHMLFRKSFETGCTSQSCKTIVQVMTPGQLQQGASLRKVCL